jgi:hypothetical protein
MDIKVHLSEIEETRSYLQIVDQLLRTENVDDILYISKIDPINIFSEVYNRVGDIVNQLVKEAIERDIVGTDFELKYDNHDEDGFRFSIYFEDIRIGWFDWTKSELSLINIAERIENDKRILAILHNKFKEKVEQKEWEIDA